jgi:hypothetical protein
MRVLRGTVTAVDAAARQVIADGRAIAYDTLVLATGATHGYFGHEEWRKHADEITGDPEVKIMKRINCRGSTLEACVTRCGTIVGPLLTEIVGQKDLTPYKGGWCGNEVFPGAFSEVVRAKAREMAFKFGNQLWQEGYRGYFDLDFLIDRDGGDVYLGELNPRVCRRRDDLRPCDIAPVPVPSAGIFRAGIRSTWKR